MENNKTLGTVSHAQSALTAAMINSVKTSMAKGICYVAAFDTACAEHAEALIARRQLARRKSQRTR